jgi:hypothetical protein
MANHPQRRFEDLEEPTTQEEFARRTYRIVKDIREVVFNPVTGLCVENSNIKSRLAVLESIFRVVGIVIAFVITVSLSFWGLVMRFK